MVEKNTLEESLRNHFFFIVGPCVIESEELLTTCAKEIQKLQKKYKVPFVFKSSFDKANRSSIDSYRGMGIQKGLSFLKKIKKFFSLPITTDVHETHQVDEVAEVADIIQIPAFLCRQTDLIVQAAKTGKIISVKKGQFLAVADLENILRKIRTQNKHLVLFLERGSSFGYQNLVVDFTNLIEMKKYKESVVMDITHATQKTGKTLAQSGVLSQYAPYFGYAAAACGAQGIFMEVHPNPAKALSDAANCIPLGGLDKLVGDILSFHKLYKNIGGI